MATDKQIEANRANAQNSTGPNTPEGKKRARMNALRHGLTGQVTLMPDEDRAAHDSFCEALLASLNPANAFERQLAQTVAEDNWRLNRAHAMEANILALGHAGEAGEIEAEHPEIHAAVTAARVFSANPHQFQLMTLYMQRTNRDIHRNLALLRQLQAERRATREAEFKESARLQQLNEMKELPYDPKATAEARSTIAGEQLQARNGSVFSITEIDVYRTHQRRLREADDAARCRYDRERYLSQGGTLAA